MVEGITGVCRFLVANFGIGCRDWGGLKSLHCGIELSFMGAEVHYDWFSGVVVVWW